MPVEPYELCTPGKMRLDLVQYAAAEAMSTLQPLNQYTVINHIKSGAKVKQTEERHANGVGCNIRIGEPPQHSRLIAFIFQFTTCSCGRQPICGL